MKKNYTLKMRKKKQTMENNYMSLSQTIVSYQNEVHVVFLPLPQSNTQWLQVNPITFKIMVHNLQTSKSGQY